MIRYSNSLVVSIVIHLLVALGIYGVYKWSCITFFQDEANEPRCSIKLSSIEIAATPKVVHKEHLKPTVSQKQLPRKTEHKKIVKAKQKTVHIKQHPKQQPALKRLVTTPAKQLSMPSHSKEIEKNCTRTVEHKTVDVAHKHTYVQLHIHEITTLIKENLYYPRRARRRGIEGEVNVRFTLQKDASVTNIEILSSQSEILSRSAKKTLENLSKKLPKPDEVLTLTVPIKYSLE